MDVSPNRVANSGKNARRDNSKTLPKLKGEQIFKQKVETTIHFDGAEEQKVITGMTKSPTQTKIPLKRSPISNLSPKTAASQRNVGRNHMKSVSKVSLPSKDIGSKKLEITASKLSFRTQSTTNNIRPMTPFGRSQTARGPTSISRRSASTISYRSLKSHKQEDPIIPPLPKVTSTSGDHECHNLSARERVAENNKLKVFETMQKKLQEMQSDFMQKFENLKLTCPEKLKVDFKFISMIKNDECRLMVKDDDLLRLPKKLPVESVHSFKQKIKVAMDSCLTVLLENLRKAQEASTDSERTINLEETHNKLEREQAVKLIDLNNTINVLCSMKNNEVDSQIVRMQKEMQDGRKALQLAEKKIVEMRTSHAEELASLEKELRDKSEIEINKRDSHISELNKKYKTLEKQYEKLCCSVQQNVEGTSNDQIEKLKLTEDLKTCKESIQTLTKKLTHAEQHISHEKKDKQEKIDSIAKLENDLEMMKKKVEDIRTQAKTENNHQLKSNQKEIANLKNALEGLEQDKHELAEQVEELKQECNVIYDLRNKLQDAEERVEELQATVEENERLASVSNLPSEVQKELEKLRQVETEKRREIEKLKVELSKAHFNICQLEEQIQRDQQLLEVRSELINSLQTNDSSQRIHLEEMFAHVGEKTNTINELNNELRTKSEEFRNLFTTLSTKQMELTRQEHMIKLLEESNERSQMLRVKQEEKIGRMEEEIAQLKQSVGIYQNNVLGNAGCKNLLFSPVPASDEYNENFYYYTSERRRKRQVDINVKKYET